MESKKARERIKLERLKRGLSQETFARMVGLSTNSYGDIENGKTRLIHPKLYTIAQKLEIPLETLLFGIGGELEFENKVKEMESLYRRQIEGLKIELAITKEELTGKNQELITRIDTLNKIIGVLQDHSKKEGY